MRTDQAIDDPLDTGHVFDDPGSDDTLVTLMNLFKRLHNRCEPPGLELAILRRLPKALLFGTLIPVGLSVIVRLLPAAADVDTAKRIMTADIFAFATVLTFWTAVLTIAIGCVVVYVLKGPAYVADAYPLEDSPRPGRK